MKSPLTIINALVLLVFSATASADNSPSTNSSTSILSQATATTSTTSSTSSAVPSTPIHILIATPPTGNRTLTLIDDTYPFNGALIINATWARGKPAEVSYHNGPTSLWYEEDGDMVHIVLALYASRANFTMSCPWTESTCVGDFTLKLYEYPW